LGVQIDRLDLTQAPNDEVPADLQRALLEWKLLFFRAPAIDVEQFYGSPALSARLSMTG
jgi:hypothetical protein